MSFYERLQEETAAERRRLLGAPVIRALFDGHASRESYLAFLAEAYHHVRHTVPLLMACGSRLPRDKEWLREAIAEYIEEECGHQEWVLNDIAAAGGDAEAVRDGRGSPAVHAMVACAYHVVDRGNPVGFFGMVHVLEGTSVELATPAAGIIGEKLGLPAEAFTYLRSHGSLDQEHIRFLASLLDRLDDPADRDAVIDTARLVYIFYGDLFRGLPMPPGAPRYAEEAA